MSNIKQLLEKANRKCEMRWRVFAFDPAKDNELVHTSKEAFDCIKMAGEYKMDLAKKHPDYIIEIIAESKERRDEGSFTVNSVNFDDKYKKAYEEAKKLGINISPSYGYPIYNNKALIQAISKKFPEKTPHISIHPYEGYYAINVVANGSIWHNLDNKKFSTVKEASEYAKQRYSYPQYIDILVSNNQPALESSQKNEAYSEQYKDAWNDLKVGDTVQVTDKDYQFTRNMKVTRIHSNGTNKIVEFDFSLPSGKKYTKPLARIYKDSNGYKAESLIPGKLYKLSDDIDYGDFNDLTDEITQEQFKKLKSLSKVKGSLIRFEKGDEIRYLGKVKEGPFTYDNFVLTKATNIPLQIERLSDFINESSQKNEEKEFTIKLVTPFGKSKVCSWKANSVDAAVKEFLDANPAYRENKKGAVIAESISDDIVREVKEEVKDGVKDLVQQDVDAKLNGEVTPADYRANFEDVDDDSDGIFGDELDNAEPDEPEQANESVDEKSLKSFLKSEYDRALKQAKNFSGTNNNFSNFYDGYAAAMKAIQEKFKL